VKININISLVIFALIAMAVVSFLVMVSMTRIDHMVHGVLYDFGLRFSYRWAMPYWTCSGIIVGLSWFNIAASTILVYYIFRGGKRSLRLKAKQAEKTEVSTGELVEQNGNLIEMQILDKYCEVPKPQVKSYDVRHPKDVVDSQC